MVTGTLFVLATEIFSMLARAMPAGNFFNSHCFPLTSVQSAAPFVDMRTVITAMKSHGDQSEKSSWLATAHEFYEHIQCPNNEGHGTGSSARKAPAPDATPWGGARIRQLSTLVRFLRVGPRNCGCAQPAQRQDHGGCSRDQLGGT